MRAPVVNSMTDTEAWLKNGFKGTFCHSSDRKPSEASDQGTFLIVTTRYASLDLAQRLALISISFN